MKNKTKLYNAISCGFVIVICFIFSKTDCLALEEKEEFRPVDINRVADVLNLIKTSVIGNYERIKTWQGEAKGIMTYGRYRTVKFNLDTQKDLLYVDDSPAELTLQRE